MRRGHYLYNYRDACAIQLQDSVIITGIDDYDDYDFDNSPSSLSRVEEYNLQGSLARLPDLNTGRRSHTCGHYVHIGQIVSRK